MVNIFACGDIVNYSNINGLICSEELANIVKGADYSICNFEAPINGFGKARPKSGPHHSQLKETIKGLKTQGFNHLLLANNHIMDYGPEGLQTTIEEIEKHGIDHSGANITIEKAYQPFVIEIKGIRIGMINAAEAAMLFGVLDYFDEDESGHAWINHARIDKAVIRLRRDCDFVMVFSHAGLEHYPIPQKEWRERYKHLCDLGADVVIGSHPHVPQGYEKYGDSLIFYSLGNFYFDSKNYKDKEDSSFSVVINLEKNETPNFKLVYHYKTKGKVHIAPSEKEVDIERLCSFLKDEYKSFHEKMSLEAYEKIKRNLLLSLLPVPFDGRLKSSFRRIVSLMLGRSKKIDKTTLQLHLFKNEAYYYATKHALETLSRKKHSSR